MQTLRLNITLPADLARDLRRAIPNRFRSKFIPGALKEKLNRKRSLKKELINQYAATVIIIPFGSLAPPVLSPDIVKAPALKGLEKESVILVDKMRSIDKARLIKKLAVSRKKNLQRLRNRSNSCWV